MASAALRARLVITWISSSSLMMAVPLATPPMAASTRMSGGRRSETTATARRSAAGKSTRSQVRLLHPGERQNPGHDLVHLVTGIQHQRQVSPGCLLLLGAIGRDGVELQLGEADHRLQQIVQLMRHAPGHAAQHG